MLRYQSDVEDRVSIDLGSRSLRCGGFPPWERGRPRPHPGTVAANGWGLPGLPVALWAPRSGTSASPSGLAGQRHRTVARDCPTSDARLACGWLLDSSRLDMPWLVPIDLRAWPVLLRRPRRGAGTQPGAEQSVAPGTARAYGGRPKVCRRACRETGVASCRLPACLGWGRESWGDAPLCPRLSSLGLSGQPDGTRNPGQYCRPYEEHPEGREKKSAVDPMPEALPPGLT
jgi:hypothetical protein